MYYELTDGLETGDPVIDREHRELFGTVNCLLGGCPIRMGSAAIEDMIRFLSDYVQQHGAHEEYLMQRCDYPEAAAHMASHAGLRRLALHFTAQLSPGGPTLADLEILNECFTMLARHILIEDRHLADYLKKHPIPCPDQP